MRRGTPPGQESGATRSRCCGGRRAGTGERGWERSPNACEELSVLRARRDGGNHSFPLRPLK